MYARFYLANLVPSLQSSGVFFCFQDPQSQLDNLVLSFSEDFFMTSLCVGGSPLVLSLFLLKSGQGLQQHIDLVGISVLRCLVGGIQGLQSTQPSVYGLHPFHLQLKLCRLCRYVCGRLVHPVADHLQLIGGHFDRFIALVRLGAEGLQSGLNFC